MAAESGHSTDDKCRNCGSILTGEFCAHCGQAEHLGHPPTIAHFFHDLVHELLHVDGKIFLTLKALFFQPGKLTEEYWAGRVASWVRPLRVFIIVLAFQALVSRGQGPLNHQVQVKRSVLSGSLSVNIASDLWKIDEQEKSVAASDSEITEFSRKFEKGYTAVRYSSVLVFALAEWVLYRRRQPYFVNHLIAGLHFYSFWYVIAAFASPLGRISPVWNNLVTLSALYLFAALHRLFRERWFISFVKGSTLYLFVFLTEFGMGYAVAKWIEH
jgi:hypothetical protein